MALLTIAVGIIYLQYRFYRTPVADPTDRTREQQIISGGPPQDGIPSIDEPHFESVAFADQYLDDRGLGLVVALNGRTRFYPYQILVWHQVVNDTFNGQPLLITYCPLTAAGIVFERGGPLTFGVSGKLYNSNLLMYDRATHSLWSQMLGEAITGEKISSRLSQYPSSVISWNAFKQQYPGGQVLSRETGFVRDYTHNPYADYEASHAIHFPINHDDPRLTSKTIVFGVESKDGSLAFPLETVKTEGSIDTHVGSAPVTIFWDEEWETVRAVERIDDPSASVWNAEKNAVPLTRAYWFAWAAMHPETNLFN